MKTTLLLVMLCYGVFAKAQTIDTAKINHQTDSIRTELNHIKQLFMDGTISASEYAAMRARVLGISTIPTQQPIIIQQAPAQTTKQQINSWAKEEQHFRDVGAPLLGFSTLMTVAGGLAIGISVAVANKQASTLGVYNAQGLSGGVIAGIVLMCTSTPLWISGGVEIGKANEYRRRINGTASLLKLQISPMALAITF